MGAPDGVDCFFENVGNADSSAIIGAMNNFGRIACCGSISSYNEKEPPLVPSTAYAMFFKQLKMEGFMVQRAVSHLTCFLIVHWFLKKKKWLFLLGASLWLGGLLVN